MILRQAARLLQWQGGRHAWGTRCGREWVDNGRAWACVGWRVRAYHSHNAFSTHLKGITKRLNKDDEAGDALGSVDLSPLEEGEFFDVPGYDNRPITRRDVGKKVTVGEPVIQELTTLFGLTRAQALHTVRSPHFLLVADGAVLRTIYFLKDRGIRGEQVMRVPWILRKSEDDLHAKFPMVTGPNLFLSYEDGLGFCHFTKEHIRKYQRMFKVETLDFPDHPNRLYYIAERLKIPVARLTEMVVKPKRLLYIDMKKVEEVLEVLERHNVDPEDVIRDLWVFYHNPQQTDQRLYQAKAAGCQRLKLWMTRCPEYIFNRTCERHQSHMEVLGGKRMTQYIAERLECDEQVVVEYAKINQGLQRVHVSKVKSQIDYLFSEGFTPEQIRASMRILLYSEKRTAERIKRLKEIGYFPISVTVLYKAPRQFERYYESLRHYYERAMGKIKKD